MITRSYFQEHNPPGSGFSNATDIHSYVFQESFFDYAQSSRAHAKQIIIIDRLRNGH